jgi:hypothetical protein
MYFNNRICNQRPKSFSVIHIDEIFKIFFFYSRLVFDDTTEVIKESQRNIKQTQLKLKERITKSEKEISVIEKRISKFKRALDTTEELDIVKFLSRQITENESKLNELENELPKIKIDYELENDKFNQNEREITYYDVKEKINGWFYKMNIEEQRNELIRIIKTCKVFTHYLIIDTGKVVFLFDINQHYVFDIKLLENLNKDEVYKEHFIEVKNRKLARTFNGKLIPNIKLKNDDNTRSLVFTYFIEKLGIAHNLNETANVISFVSLSGLYSQE